MTRAKLLTLLIVFTFNSVCAQLNGEFWWLNDKLNNFRKTRPTEPEIEILSEFDNDETAKIVFRDSELFTNKLTNSNHKNKKRRLYEHSDGKIVWPSEFNKHNGNAKKNMKLKDPKSKIDDEFVFIFPMSEKNGVNVDVVSNSTNAENGLSAEITFHDKASAETQKVKEAQNICTYLKKNDCFVNKGVIYKEWNQKEPSDKETVCCILPIQPIPKTNEASLISFPGATHIKPRHKRSDDGGLNQRNFLLLHKLSQQQIVQQRPNPTAKIVTNQAEDDEDPYLNIKNSRFRPQTNDKIVTPSYNSYDANDYDDYASELPKPGLVGLYSDHDMSPSSWSFTSNTGLSYGGIPPESVPEEDYVDDDVGNDYDTFGYSTIDPRKVTGGQKQKTKPVKFTTVSDVTLDAQSHTINFHSNPDFQVLQGFKLLNLFRDRSRFHNQNSRQTTTEKIYDSREFLGSVPEESEEVGDEFFEEDQLFGGCGKAVAIKAKEKGDLPDKPLGDASNGSHPWLALVVLTKRRHNVLCYATLIHPRAVITVADCVHGTSPRDITVFAGAFDLTDRSRLKSRVADVHVHPRYKAGDVDYNLAVLHWMRPLILGTNIQPACLSEPHIGDDCRFYGWGSLDQGILTRSRWQRASIRMCDTLNKKAHKHSETFCASVSRGHVTSLGGPLICDVDGHRSVVGVVVSMDKGYVLMPVREFGMKASELLSGD